MLTLSDNDQAVISKNLTEISEILKSGILNQQRENGSASTQANRAQADAEKCILRIAYAAGVGHPEFVRKVMEAEKGE